MVEEIPSKTRRSRSPRARMAALVVAAATLAVPASASAAFEVTNFSADSYDSGGGVETRAGARPHIAENVIDLSVTTNNQGAPIPDGNVKDVIVDLPPGFVGNPNNVPKCAQKDLMDLNSPTGTACPPSSQVGMMTLSLAYGFQVPFPVFNMEPPPGVPAQFAFPVLSVPVYINASVRPDDHGLRMKILNNSSALPLVGTKLELWGVPSSSDHDALRGGPSGAPMKAFLSNPDDCASGPPVTRVRANSWQNPDEWATAEFVGEQLTGCEALEFDPDISVQPVNKKADTPSGYRIELTATQTDNPSGLATANLKQAVVTMPEGTAINPSAANGLEACSEAQIGVGTGSEITCPDASKIGQVTLDTPLQEKPMQGAIYLAEQDNNPFGSTLAVYLAPAGGGVQLKLPGEITTDPDTGQLTTTFDNNPQLPFNSFVLEFKGGQRAPLVNPSTCGIKPVSAEFTPWSASDHGNPAPGEVVERDDAFEITQSADGGACASNPADRPFDPSLRAGVMTPVAGSYTPFVFRLTREDGHQEILATDVTAPEGLSARLAGIPLCSDADANAGNCGAGSRVGDAVVGAGAGANPFYIQPPSAGDVFLAGPYDPDGPGGEPQAPLSLAISVPAVAGPLNLGDVNVRAAVYVDPTTVQLRVVSDPIPQILEGVPLRIRDIRIRLDRPEFTITPTDCTESQVKALVHGSHGASSEEQARFQVGECASLGFSPDLKFRVTGGKKATKRNGHPGLRAVLTKPDGEANISRVEALLPKGMLLDQNADALGDPCTRTEYDTGTCPESSKVGSAVAHSPLLDEPLSGPVYLRTSDNPLPDLVADLNGIVDIDLVARIDQKVVGKGKRRTQRIRNTFDLVPDVPVTSFDLKIAGGNGGMLVNENSGRGLCTKGRRQINLAIDAHNGLAKSSKTRLKARCGKGKKKRRQANRKAAVASGKVVLRHG